jgi:hypothetical protein
VAFSQFLAVCVQQRTGLLAEGTWMPMAAVHLGAMTAALLAGWMAARAKTCSEAALVA